MKKTVAIYARGRIVQFTIILIVVIIIIFALCNRQQIKEVALNLRGFSIEFFQRNPEASTQPHAEQESANPKTAVDEQVTKSPENGSKSQPQRRSSDEKKQSNDDTRKTVTRVNQHIENNTGTAINAGRDVNFNR